MPVSAAASLPSAQTGSTPSLGLRAFPEHCLREVTARSASATLRHRSGTTLLDDHDAHLTRTETGPRRLQVIVTRLTRTPLPESGRPRLRYSIGQVTPLLPKERATP